MLLAVKKLKKFMEKNGLNPPAFAKLVDMSPEYVRGILSGKHQNPYLTTMLVIDKVTFGLVKLQDWTIEEDK